MTSLAETHPNATTPIFEHEPVEAFELLARDDIDRALTYDTISLSPATLRADFDVTEVWSIE